MTTVVNNPGTSDSGNSMGLVVGLLLVGIIAILFFVYGLPALRSSNVGSGTVNTVPAPVIPNKIDVNVQPAK